MKATFSCLFLSCLFLDLQCRCLVFERVCVKLDLRSAILVKNCKRNQSMMSLFLFRLCWLQNFECRHLSAEDQLLIFGGIGLFIASLAPIVACFLEKFKDKTIFLEIKQHFNSVERTTNNNMYFLYWTETALFNFVSF